LAKLAQGPHYISAVEARLNTWGMKIGTFKA
jgi:hypothetical protein